MAGDQILIAAAGSAAVPAFSTTITVPANTALTSPAGNHSFALSQGETFSWTGSADFVRVAATAGGYGFGSDISFGWSSHCVFPGAGGTATVPPGAIATFGCGGFGVSYEGGVGESQLVSGDYAISVQWLQPAGQWQAFFSSCTP